MILITKSNKYYFLLKFRFIFLNFKYLIFIKMNLQEYKEIINTLKNLKIKFLKLKFNHINTLLINKFINNVLRNNYILLYLNDFSNSHRSFLKLGNTTIDNFSFSGYFLNVNYINKLNIVYDYYVNNYFIYFQLINKYINIYLLSLFIYIVKLLTLFLKLGQKKYLK